MISTYWLEKRKSHWVRLEHLLDQAHNHGLKSLTRSELQELGLLYRQAAADLSVLREDPTAQNYSRSLNLLLARAHNTIYSGEKSSPFKIFHFYRYTYPAIFRRQLPLVTTAFLIFFLGSVIGLLLTLTNPDFMRLYLGPHMMETLERHEMWTDSVVAIKPAAASGIMTNNMTVSFIAFAFGITFGAGTVYAMLHNGILLGVIGGACWFYGMSLSLWSFVAPHGVLELPAIFIAGAAGLLLARGMLFPGLLPRRDSIARAGTEGVQLMLGTIPILIVAGSIEGFISPSHLAPHWKFTLAAIFATIFFLYLFLPVEKSRMHEPALAMAAKG
ncbi:MAG TPA: stage II sporulation protein M [Candidatus Angelobacter sp.]